MIGENVGSFMNAITAPAPTRSPSAAVGEIAADGNREGVLEQIELPEFFIDRRELHDSLYRSGAVVIIP